MLKKSLRTKINLFFLYAVLGCSHLACANDKTYNLYDQNPYGSMDHASVKKVGPNQYAVKIQPTEANIGVGVYGGTVEAKNRWDAVQKVEPSFDTGRKEKK